MDSTTGPGLDLPHREIGRYRGADAGACVVVVGGIHGNEPAGIEAGRRVLQRLARGDVPVRGDVVVLAGNVTALRQGRRYLVRDLNRAWTDDDVRALRAAAQQGAPGTTALSNEDQEQLELHHAIEDAFAAARGPRVLADLHTSSAPGVPFVLVGDTIPQCEFVRAFPIPVILGLLEQVDGTLGDLWTRQGVISFSVEGGQHDAALSRDSLEAVLWLSLAQAGCVDDSLPEVRRGRALLDDQRGDLPRVLEVMFRHAITAADAFVMEPGFRNIERVSRGQLLARDVRGEIRAQQDGVVVLPLYQQLGNDGFFWAREVSDTRMRASELLRRLPLDGVVTMLPGIRRDREHPERLIVESGAVLPSVADLLHMLGYRKERRHGGTLTLERAPQQ